MSCAAWDEDNLRLRMSSGDTWDNVRVGWVPPKLDADEDDSYKVDEGKNGDEDDDYNDDEDRSTHSTSTVRGDNNETNSGNKTTKRVLRISSANWWLQIDPRG